MKVRILDELTGELVGALIRPAAIPELPSMQDGWQFNFRKLAAGRGMQAYVLVTDAAPQVVEGALLFKMQQKIIPYMAYLEIAPHNKGRRKYGYVAGCLIAFAFRKSLTDAEEPFKGQLFFDVLEERKEDQIKLMTVYSQKYGAKRLGMESTTMVIMDEAGELLVQTYLERK
jgi:hypothetical protein